MSNYIFYQVNFENDRFIMNWDESSGDIQKGCNLINQLNKIYNLSKDITEKNIVRVDWLWRTVASFEQYCTVIYNDEIITNVPFNYSEINQLIEKREKDKNFSVSKNHILNSFKLNENSFMIKERHREEVKL